MEARELSRNGKLNYTLPGEEQLHGQRPGGLVSGVNLRRSSAGVNRFFVS
jgi:hypothetical protein